MSGLSGLKVMMERGAHAPLTGSGQLAPKRSRPIRTEDLSEPSSPLYLHSEQGPARPTGGIPHYLVHYHDGKDAVRGYLLRRR